MMSSDEKSTKSASVSKAVRQPWISPMARVRIPHICKQSLSMNRENSTENVKINLICHTVARHKKDFFDKRTGFSNVFFVWFERGESVGCVMNGCKESGVGR